MYTSYEEKFNVIYPESKNATYSSLLNFSSEVDKSFQRWFRYKEGYSTSLVTTLINEYNKNKNGIILDPFLGSGSTLVAATELGLKGIGYEVNPFSTFLSKLKLKNYTKEFANEFANIYLRILEDSEVKNFKYELPKLSISKNVFTSEIEKFYMGLKEYIKNDTSIKTDIKELLLLGWLANLEYISNYKKSGNGLKKRKYVKPRIITIEDVKKLLKNQYSNMYDDIVKNTLKSEIKIYNKTCLDMSEIKTKSISGIIFSPPYANCFDYTEIYKLELWFGDFVKEYDDLKKLRKKSLRSHLNGVDLNDENIELKSVPFLSSLVEQVKEKDLWSKKIPNMLKFYFHDMFTLLENCYRVLEDDGFCSIIVSNSAYGGIVIPTDLILAEYAKDLGFEVDKIEIDRYIITSSQQYEATKENKKFLRESVICLKKNRVKNLEVVEVENLPMNIVNSTIYSINQKNINSYTHNYFKYPCKFIPEIPRWAIKKYGNTNFKVFDPFSGSGTTLTEAIINGYDAYGTEIDDVAKLLVKVKTTVLDKNEINRMKAVMQEINENINKDVNNEYCLIPDINNIKHWFPEENIVKLGQIRFYIENIKSNNIKDFLKVCFASIIRKCSFADEASPKPYVSSKIKKLPKEPIKEFINVFNKYIQGMESLLELNIKNKAKIINGDALSIKDNIKVDLAITSPPYINAFDYARTMRLENLWLGYLREEEITKKKQFYVGTENIKKNIELEELNILSKSKILNGYFRELIIRDEKRALIVKRFFQDMLLNLQEIYNILNNGGIYCIVIGNSKIRDIEIESWKVLKELALSIGFNVDVEFSYIIKNPYLNIPRKGRGGKINIDYIIVLKK